MTEIVLIVCGSCASTKRRRIGLVEDSDRGPRLTCEIARSEHDAALREIGTLTYMGVLDGPEPQRATRPMRTLEVFVDEVVRNAPIVFWCEKGCKRPSDLRSVQAAVAEYRRVLRRVVLSV